MLIRKSQRGFTLIELLLMIGLIILIASLASAALADITARLRARSTGSSLEEFIQLARNEALFRQQIVTLCPLNAGQCSNNWRNELVQFSDSNANAKLDGSEEVIRYWNRPRGNAEISWRNRGRYIRFRPNGSTTALTGSLRYCAEYKPEINSFRVVIARTGRSRIEWHYAECVE